MSQRRVFEGLLCACLLGGSLGCEAAKPSPNRGILLELRAFQYDSTLSTNLSCAFSAAVPLDGNSSGDTTTLVTAFVSRDLYSPQGVVTARADTVLVLQVEVGVHGDSVTVLVPQLGDRFTGIRPSDYYSGLSGAWACTDRFPLVSDPALGGTDIRGRTIGGTWQLHRVVPIG